MKKVIRKFYCKNTVNFGVNNFKKNHFEIWLDNPGVNLGSRCPWFYDFDLLRPSRLSNNICGRKLACHLLFL